jgi:ATP adenylyltransferase
VLAPDAPSSLQLNKYSVVEEHFLLVTKGTVLAACVMHGETIDHAFFCRPFVEFQSQTAPLRPGDLVQSYLLLHAARAAGKHLFAFYNCA